MEGNIVYNKSLPEEDLNLPNTQARTWCLTINNEERTDEELLKYVEGLEHFKYCVFQREKGHLTGTEHIQMYIEFVIGKRFGTIKQYFPTAHIEKRKGTKTEAREYCMKSDTRISGPYEIGIFADERSRTDIKNLLDMVKSGASDYELLNTFPTQFVRMGNMISKVRNINLEEEFKNKFRNLDVTYIYGASRTGKTSFVLNKYGYSNVYRLPHYKSGMFDTYNGQDVILFDEFHSQIDLVQMLQLLDGYPLMLPCRFNDKVACYTKVYIISNISIYGQYPYARTNDKDTWNAFLNRIHHFKIFKGNGVIYDEDNKENLDMFAECDDGDMPF